jgi:hypothetical protein
MSDKVESRQLALLNEINDNEYDSYLAKLPEAKVRKIRNRINAYKTGVYASAPVVCYGPAKCPFINKCPIPDINQEGELDLGEDYLYPVGRECIMEREIVKSKTLEYLHYLNVDPSNPVEMSIVNELALIELYKNRCVLVLSQGDKRGQGRDFLMVDVVGFNENGDRAETTKLHPVTEMIDKLERRRERWLERLMETRDSKAKFLTKMHENKNQSRVLEEIAMLRDALYAIDVTPSRREILIDEE